jgi:methylmalonyl-CoA mutase C-terminal domain/subunit
LTAFNGHVMVLVQCAKMDITMRGSSQPVRMVLAKCGLDAHERGIHVIAMGLRDFGFEVIYLGLRRTPQAIIAAAIQEDADVIGLSTLSGNHRKFVARVVELLHRQDFSPVLVLGGVVPESDDQALLEIGVERIFRPGTSVIEIAEDLTRVVAERRRGGV